LKVLALYWTALYSFSESGDTSVTSGISDESFGAVIALVLLGVEFSSSGACDTVLSVPERKVSWAVTGVFGFVKDSSVSLLISWAFTDVVCVELSGEFTWDLAVTSLG